MLFETEDLDEDPEEPVKDPDDIDILREEDKTQHKTEVKSILHIQRTKIDEFYRLLKNEPLLIRP
jgi:hypothetical protein